MYGDTHVDPAVLADLHAGELPPDDAIEVYFPTPMSLCLFGDACARSPKMEHLLPELAEIVEHALQRAMVSLQHSGGYVEARGYSMPARLELAGISENSVPDEEIMRIHAHLYVGRTAAALTDGTRRPVDESELRQGIDDAWRTWHRELVSSTTSAFGFRWGALPGHHPADQEIVDPPFAEHVGGHARVLCPGRYGQHERLLADATSRRLIKESQQRVDAEHRRAS